MYSLVLGSLTKDTRMSDVNNYNPGGVPGTFLWRRVTFLSLYKKRKLTVNSGDLPQQREIPSVSYYR